MEKSTEVVATKTVSVAMLGGFRIEADGNVLTDEVNRSQKIWNVLCYLIVHRNRSVPLAELIDLFWPEEKSANPNNALKTLLYRARMLLDPVFPGGPEPILSQRGSYSWNPAVACEVDAERFEDLVHRAGDRRLSPDKRMKLYQEATGLYAGDYLPKLVNQMWVVPLTTHYHIIYLQAVQEYAVLLEEEGQFEQMERLCRRASELDLLDEGLHVLLVRALLRQGKDTAALNHYEKATELLYRNLGVRPSEELRALYQEIMAVEKGLELDLEVIQGNLKEVAARPGAFECEYGFFQEAYRLEARRAARNGTSIHIALMTVSMQDGTVPPLGILNDTMDRLRDVVVGSLRRGDVVSRYSGAQYVVMLPAANFEDSTKVMNRVVSQFYRQYTRNTLKITFKVRQIELI